VIGAKIINKVIVIIQAWKLGSGFGCASVNKNPFVLMVMMNAIISAITKNAIASEMQNRIERLE